MKENQEKVTPHESSPFGLQVMVLLQSRSAVDFQCSFFLPDKKEGPTCSISVQGHLADNKQPPPF